MSYSFLQPPLAAQSFTLQSRQTEGKVQGIRGSLFLAALQKLRGNSDLSAELEEMLAEQAAVKGQRAKNPWELFQNPALRWQLMSIVVLSSAMQLCGNDSVSSLAATAISGSTVLPDTVQALGFNVPAAGEEGIVVCSACGDLQTSDAWFPKYTCALWQDSEGCCQNSPYDSTLVMLCVVLQEKQWDVFSDVFLYCFLLSSLPRCIFMQLMCSKRLEFLRTKSHML